MKQKSQYMEHKAYKVLMDIQMAIDNINRYLGENKSFVEYDTNFLLQDAVERNLITIGEAMNNLLKIVPDIHISNARRIVDTRNRLTHGYDDIENVQVWNIIIKHLPILENEIKEYLEK